MNAAHYGPESRAAGVEVDLGSVPPGHPLLIPPHHCPFATTSPVLMLTLGVSRSIVVIVGAVPSAEMRKSLSLPVAVLYSLAAYMDSSSGSIN